MFRPDTEPALVEWIVEDMASAPPDAAVDELRHAIGNDGPVMRALPQLHVPFVAINPDYRPTDAESLRRYGIETVIATDVGHFLMLEDPAQFNRLLADVLDTRIQRRGG